MMHSVTRSTLTVTVLLFTSLPVLANRSLTVSPDSTLSLVGDSTLHPFTSKSSQIQLTTEIDPSAGDAIPATLGKQALKRFDLTVPVQSLKSKESGLDKNMYKALKAEDCPTIDFHMKSYEVATSTNTTLPVKAIGTLTIACHEQPVTLEGTLTPESNTLHVQGTYPLLMTDYGIKPPTMMMGTIKVRNPVKVYFDLQLR